MRKHTVGSNPTSSSKISEAEVLMDTLSNWWLTGLLIRHAKASCGFEPHRVHQNICLALKGMIMRDYRIAVFCPRCNDITGWKFSTEPIPGIYHTRCAQEEEREMEETVDDESDFEY